MGGQEDLEPRDDSLRPGDCQVLDAMEGLTDAHRRRDAMAARRFRDAMAARRFRDAMEGSKGGQDGLVALMV